MSRIIVLVASATALLCSSCCRGKEASDDGTGAPVAPVVAEPIATLPTATSPTVRAVPTPPPLPPPRPTVAEVPHDDNDVPGQTFRVRFERGTSGATLKGSVIRGERNRYLLGAAKGQLLRASITSLENNASFSVLAPGGATIPGTEEERDLTSWTGRLPASGNTTVVVGPTRGNATYTIHVEITSD